MAGLALRCLHDRGWIDWMSRALRVPAPAGTAERRTYLRVLSEIARSAERSGVTDLLDASAARVLELFRDRPLWARSGAIYQEEGLNPVALAAGRRVETGDLARAFELLRAATRAGIGGMPATFQRLRQKATARELADAVLAGPADHAALAEFVLEHYRDPALAIEVLEKGVARGDAAYRRRLALLCARNGRRARALEIGAALLRGDVDPAIRESVELMCARLHLAAGDRASACAALRALEKRGPARPAHAAEIFDAAGDDEAALKLYRRAEELGAAPNIQLARLLHRASRLEDALRYYDRDIARGSEVAPWPPDEDLGAVPAREDAASTAAEGRAQVLRQMRKP